MADEVAPPKADDNLITRRAQVKNNIELIKQKKQRILAALQGISKSEEPDKVTMEKLVGAFDTLGEQEKQYMEILKSIVDIHEKATSDVAEEVEILRAAEGSKKEGEEKNIESSEDIDYDADRAEIEQTLKEISEVSAKALAASLVNEQLVAKLSLHKSKHIAVKEQRSDKASALAEQARQALLDVEKTRLKVASERQTNEKKKKELDTLRKGVMKKEMEGGEEAVDEITISPTDRIPPVVAVEETKEEKSELDEQTLEQRRSEIRARVKAERERREQLQATIREKFAAMEARRERMDAIRRILSGDAVPQNDNATEQGAPRAKSEQPSSDENEADRARVDIEMNLASAQMSLQHLTAMRERLERLQSSGTMPTLEDDQLMEALDNLPEDEDEDNSTGKRNGNHKSD